MSRPTTCNCPHRDRVIAPRSLWFHLPTDPVIGELQEVVGPITYEQAKKDPYFVGEPTDDFILVVGANDGNPTLRVNNLAHMNHEWGCPNGLGYSHRYTPITNTDHMDGQLMTKQLRKQINKVHGKIQP